MKKILAIAVALIMVLALVPAFALADTTVVNDEAGILAALTAGGDFELGANITVDDSSLSTYTNSVTLDLKGYTLYFENSALTFSGEGVTFILKDTKGGGLLDFADYYVRIVNHATMTLMSGTISAFWYGIAAFTYATVNVEGGAIYTTKAGSGCISGNGTVSYGNGVLTDYGHTTINISGGVLEAEYGVKTKDVASVAIYHPQSGVLNISGGTLKGGTGITMMAGILNMTGGTVTGTSSGAPLTDTNDGPKGNGSAICLVSNPGYAGNINVTVSGGTLTSDYTDAIAELRYDSTLTQNQNTGHYVTTQVQRVIVNNENGTKINVPEGKNALNNGFDEGVATVAANVVINDKAGSEVRANASPTFIVTIPAIVDFGTISRGMEVQTHAFNVSIADAVFADGMQVVVGTDEPEDGFKMTEASGGATLAYEMSATTFTFTNAMVSADHAKTIESDISTDPNNITIAGAYSDLLVFSIEYTAVVIVP